MILCCFRNNIHTPEHNILQGSLNQHLQLQYLPKTQCSNLIKTLDTPQTCQDLSHIYILFVLFPRPRISTLITSHRISNLNHSKIKCPPLRKYSPSTNSKLIILSEINLHLLYLEHYVFFHVYPTNKTL